jgi:hypothetical protein
LVLVDVKLDSEWTVCLPEFGIGEVACLDESLSGDLFENMNPAWPE